MRMPYNPAPTPPKTMQPSIRFHIGARPASGVKLSCMELTAPQEVPVVATAQSTLFMTPNRCSLPSMNEAARGHDGIGLRFGVPGQREFARQQAPASRQTSTRRGGGRQSSRQTHRPGPPGMMIRPSISRKLVSGVGFSNGWALFWPKNPPPLVPSCLMAICDAAGPVGIGWVVTCASTMTGTLVIMTLPLASFLRHIRHHRARRWRGRACLGRPDSGPDTVTAILVMTGWPLASVLGTWVV